MKQSLWRMKAMRKTVQLQLPLESPEDKRRLLPKEEKKTVAALATLLLQVLCVEEQKEPKDE